MDKWFSISELLSFDVPKWPKSERGLLKKALREGFSSRKRAKIGGGNEYHMSCLPIEIRQRLILETGSEVTKKKNTTSREVANYSGNNLAPQDLSGSARATRDARAAFVQHVNQLALHIGRSKAVDAIVAMVKDGDLPEHLESLVSVANAKSGKTVKGSQKCQRLARRTLYTWVTEFQKGGIDALAPKSRQAEWDMPDWVPFLINLWADPRWPSLQACMEVLPSVLPSDVKCPSYHQANRYLKQKLNIVERHKGRMGPQQLKSLKAFTRRDTSDLWPGAVFSSDGHTMKAKVEHPFHGRPFKPEVTLVIDVYTRYIVGWSVGLAENSIGVLEALSSSMVARDDGRKRALPAIWYTDHGAGFKAKISLDNGQVFNVVVRSSDGATIFNPGTDYSVDQITGVITLPDGSTITPNQTVNVDYDVADPSQVTAADIIGTVDIDAVSTGLQALFTARQKYGFTARQIVALGFSGLPTVAAAMNVIAAKTRARAYVDVPMGTTFREAIEGRGPLGIVNLRLASPNVVYLYNHIRVAGPDGETRLEGQSARRAGLRARVDRELDFTESASSKEYRTVIDLEFTLTEDQIQLLNANGIETVKNEFGGGFIAFGNRTSNFPGEQGIETFEATLHAFDTHDEAMEAISNRLIRDRKLTAGTTTRLNQALQAYIDTEVSDERMIRGSVAFINPARNPPSQIENGTLKVSRRYIVGPPAERVIHEAEIEVSLLSNIIT